MKIYIEDGQAIPAIQVLQDSDPSPSGYTEVTGIEEIADYGVQAIDVNTIGWYDKKCVREKVKTAVYTKMGVTVPADLEDPAKWNLLTAGEKNVAAHWFIVAKEEFLLEVENNLRYWTVQAMDYRSWTMDARLCRLKSMEATVYLRILDLGYAKGVLADMAQITAGTIVDIDGATNKLNSKVPSKRMTAMYVEGLQSEANDGIVALEDYVNSTTGTVFETDGFRQLDPTKFRAGHTPDSVADELLTIIDNAW